MCHEPTNVGLPQSIGIGKGTVSLDDFDSARAGYLHRAQSGHQSPRMMGTLHELARKRCRSSCSTAARAGARAFHRSAKRHRNGDLQFDPIASTYYQVKAGGDAAVPKASPKRCCSWMTNMAMRWTTPLLPSTRKVLRILPIRRRPPVGMRLRRRAARAPGSGTGRRRLREIQRHHRDLRHGHYAAQ